VQNNHARLAFQPNAPEQDTVQELGINMQHVIYRSRLITLFICVSSISCALLCIGCQFRNDEADQLWAQGNRREAVAIYSSIIDEHQFYEAGPYERTIDYYVETKALERARHYCKVAVERGLTLQFQAAETNALLDETRANVAKLNEEARAKTTAEADAREHHGEWYQGGGLHGVALKEWRSATQQDKLATIADLLAALLEYDHRNVGDMDLNSIKNAAQSTVEQLDRISQDRTYDDLTVASLTTSIYFKSKSNSDGFASKADDPKILNRVMSSKGCLADRRNAAAKSNPRSSTVGMAVTGDVFVNIETVSIETHWVRIRGITNLPQGTILMLSVEEASPSGFQGQSRTAVGFDGTFESELFGPTDGLKNGRYFAGVVMPYAFVQPASVQEIIGSKGERLTGPLVKHAELGATVSIQKKSFLMGGTNAAASQRVRTNDRIQQYKGWADYVVHLQSLVQKAHSLNLLKNENDVASLAKWGEFARAYRAESQSTMEKLLKLDSPYPRLLIGAVMSDIDSMFSAIAFKKAEQDYQDAKREYDKDLTELEKFIKEEEEEEASR
jgi:hypothetical protein